MQIPAVFEQEYSNYWITMRHCIKSLKLILWEWDLKRSHTVSFREVSPKEETKNLHWSSYYWNAAKMVNSCFFFNILFWSVRTPLWKMQPNKHSKPKVELSQKAVHLVRARYWTINIMPIFEVDSAVLGQNEGKKDKRQSLTACSYCRIYCSKKGMCKMNNCS